MMFNKYILNFFLTLILVFVSFFSTVSSAKDIVSYPWYGERNLFYDYYYKDVLTLALKKSTDKFGEFEINEVSGGVPQGQMIRLIQQSNVVNLFWTMTSKEREERLLPIRFPIFKGLLGCRVFLIKKNNQHLFDNMTNPEQLKKLVAGQGSDWPDTTILESNQFNLITAQEYINLFAMLKKQRFDYFPRALHEAVVEADKHPELAIERRFLLKYDSPFFFFVSKENTRLAERLEYGLNKAQKDGSFDELFRSHTMSKGIFNQLSLNNREVIHLKNPLLSKATEQYLRKNETNCLSN